MKDLWRSWKAWYFSNSKKERGAIICVALAVSSYSLNPIKLEIVGVAIAIGFLTVLVANTLVKLDMLAFLKPLPVLLLIGSFAYLRSFPFNPGHLHFWLFLLCFYSTLVAVILMASTTLFK